MATVQHISAAHASTLSSCVLHPSAHLASNMCYALCSYLLMLFLLYKVLLDSLEWIGLESIFAFILGARCDD